MTDLKEWLFEQQRKKYRYFYQNILRQNLSDYEKESLNKVYGRLQQIDDTLKFMGVPKKDRIAYMQEDARKNLE